MKCVQREAAECCTQSFLPRAYESIHKVVIVMRALNNFGRRSQILVQAHIVYSSLLSASPPLSPKLYKASGNSGLNMEGNLWFFCREFAGWDLV